MVNVRFEVPEGVLAALRKDPESFGREVRLAAAIMWYERKMVSQGRAAEIAGVSRAELIAALARYGVSPFQASADEVVDEALRAG